jgi:hypothetical protein
VAQPVALAHPFDSEYSYAEQSYTKTGRPPQERSAPRTKSGFSCSLRYVLADVDNLVGNRFGRRLDLNLLAFLLTQQRLTNW